MNLKDYLEKESKLLLELKQRYYFLVEFEKQLSNIAKAGETFPITNLTSWELRKSCEDSLIVDLASWANGMRERFFNKIKQTCDDFKKYKFVESDYCEPSVRYLNYTPTDEQMEKHRKSFKKDYFKRMKSGQREIIEELFEGLLNKGSPKVNHADIDSLAEKFDRITAKVRDDRDNYRAHKYEGEITGGFTPISLNELGETFDNAEGILNGIRSMISASTLVFSEVFDTNSAAEDLLNSIYYGSHSRMIAMLGAEDYGLKYQRETELKKKFKEFVSDYNNNGKDFQKLFWTDFKKTNQ